MLVKSSLAPFIFLFYTGKENIFYLELAIDGTQFIKLHDFETHEAPDPDELIAQANAGTLKRTDVPTLTDNTDSDDLLSSLGM